MSLQPQEPRFRQLAGILRAAIEAGEYPPGAAVPTAADLGQQYGVSEATANNALAVLRREGLVTSRHGAGTFVRLLPVIHRRAPGRFARSARESGQNRGAFDGEIRHLGMVPSVITHVSREIPPADAAEVLDLAEGQQCLVRRRKMYANDQPVQFAPSYIPLDIAGGTQLEQEDTGPGGTIARMRDLGHAQVRITESVRARRATAEESAFLQLESDQPVIEILHIGWTKDDRAVEVGVWAVPASGWVLDYGWPLD